MLRNLVAIFILFPGFSPGLVAQTPERPLTSKELVTLIYQLPRNPSKRDEIVEEIRRRGIGFPLTEGMRSLVATKSGNDSLLRRTLEEAERRRVNPTASALPPTIEANELLSRTRAATLAATEAMPDFLVRQLIRRSEAFGNTSNWIARDNLTIAVSYRANVGEEYKVLTKNGLPLAQASTQGRDYSDQVGGSTSTGEYVTGLASIFKSGARTEFTPVDTDLLRGRRTLVYQFVVERPNSDLQLKAGKDLVTIVGSQGRIWIDRELNRVLRFEQIATEVPANFPITAASSIVDYDWVTISEKKYLLPLNANIFITANQAGQIVQTRNQIRFRDYQKFGAELKIIDEIDDSDLPPEPEASPSPPKKP
jgi:hypothetical protein